MIYPPTPSVLKTSTDLKSKGRCSYEVARRTLGEIDENDPLVKKHILRIRVLGRLELLEDRALTCFFEKPYSGLGLLLKPVKIAYL